MVVYKMSELTGKKSFVLYCDYEQHIALLNDEDAGKLFKAIFTYIKTNKVPELSPVSLMAFSFIRSQLDRDQNKWVDIKEKRAEAGRKGGIQSGKQRKANKANDCLASEIKANEADTDTVTDNDICVNVTDSKHIYGEYNHVRLTDSEHQKLISDYGTSIIDDYIQRLDEYIQTSGKKYKDHNLTIRQWIRKGNGTNGNTQLHSEQISEYAKISI